tara:strand:- start:405 stop:683 length:279 start_codon:yes stop_codon:yes gene_type:complete
MGSNHMHNFLRKSKENNTIPTHDPYTGELNPLYEELTGNKNPLTLDIKHNPIDYDKVSMDDLVKSLEGKDTFNSTNDVYIIKKLIKFYKENK